MKTSFQATQEELRLTIPRSAQWAVSPRQR